MRFSKDQSIKGDYDVVARGASSMVAKEVRGQALSMFVSTMQPEQRQRVDWAKLTEQQAEVLDLKDIVMSEEEFQERQNSPSAQMASQMMQMQQQLQLALMQGQVAEAQAKAAKAQADATKADAEAINKKVEAVYAAFQAAGAAAMNPIVAPAGDEILRSAGWKDATPETSTEQAMNGIPQMQPVQQEANPEREVAKDMLESPHQGQRAGIQTEELM